MWKHFHRYGVFAPQFADKLTLIDNDVSLARSIAEHTFSISVFAFFVSGNTENIKSAVKTKFANTSARMTTEIKFFFIAYSS